MRSKYRRIALRLIISSAFFAPLAISIPYIEYEARELTETSAMKTANVILEQSESIFDQVKFNVQRYEPTFATPCVEWAKTVRILPYLRSLFVLDGNKISCTSITDSIPMSTIDYFARYKVTGSEFKFESGAPFSPNKAVIMYHQITSEGYTIVAFIDGQYFSDLLYTPAWEGIEKISLRLNDAELSSTSLHTARVDAGQMYSAKSLRYPLIVQAYPASYMIGSYRAELMFRWIPWAIILGGVLSILVSRDLKYRASTKSELSLALAQEEFFVDYQPIVDAISGRCVGVEALLRWRHPLQGLVPPDIFIPQAESSGKIIDLTYRLFQCIQKDLMNTSLPKKFHLAINIAAEHFSSPNIVTDLAEFYSSLNQPDILIVAEITERQLAKNDAITQATIQALRKAGVQLAIDDFGTGQSSLAYLQNFEFDYLKVDKFFVATVDYPSVNTPVLDAIIELGKRLELKLVAEGVENETQAEYMRSQGVEYLQGFRYARPMPWSSFEVWLKARYYS